MVLFPRNVVADYAFDTSHPEKQKYRGTAENRCRQGGNSTQVLTSSAALATQDSPRVDTEAVAKVDAARADSAILPDADLIRRAVEAHCRLWNPFLRRACLWLRPTAPVANAFGGD